MTNVSRIPLSLIQISLCSGSHLYRIKFTSIFVFLRIHKKTLFEIRRSHSSLFFDLFNILSQNLNLYIVIDVVIYYVQINFLKIDELRVAHIDLVIVDKKILSLKFFDSIKSHQRVSNAEFFSDQF